MGGHEQNEHGGFTLIELSIVLVIIGLIIGGVLVGQSLIAAAGVRGQITQIERYNQAANAFYGKYGYLPGDIPAAPAAQFGFATRGSYVGQGDGNGIIESISATGAGNSCDGCVTGGEAAMFWVDLSTALLIDGSFTTATATNVASSNVPQSGVVNYMPLAKIGRGNYVYVWTGGNVSNGGGSGERNMFGLAGMSGLISWGPPQSYTALTVQDAYSMDSKVDDGLPLSGNMQASFVTSSGSAVINAIPTGVSGVYVSRGTATPGTSTSCVDNGGSASNPFVYSVEISNGTGVNCAVSFHLQSGD